MGWLTPFLMRANALAGQALTRTAIMGMIAKALIGYQSNHEVIDLRYYPY